MPEPADPPPWTRRRFLTAVVAAAAASACSGTGGTSEADDSAGPGEGDASTTSGPDPADLPIPPVAGANTPCYTPVRPARGGAPAGAPAARGAAGGVARAFLRELGIETWSFTAEVGGVALDPAKATRSRDEIGRAHV